MEAVMAPIIDMMTVLSFYLGILSIGESGGAVAFGIRQTNVGTWLNGVANAIMVLDTF